MVEGKYIFVNLKNDVMDTAIKFWELAGHWKEIKVEYSKAFVKAVRKLSGKMLDSVRNAIQKVIEARYIDEITDCKKLVGYDFFAPAVRDGWSGIFVRI